MTETIELPALGQEVVYVACSGADRRAIVCGHTSTPGELTLAVLDDAGVRMDFIALQAPVSAEGGEIGTWRHAPTVADRLDEDSDAGDLFDQEEAAHP